MDQNSKLTQPMTLRHGQKLYDTSQLIDQKVEKLLPLLALLEEKAETDADENNPGDDPILLMLDLLERILQLQGTQAAAMSEIDRKLSIVLESLPAATR